MNPLFRNDAQGAFPDSWYVASSDIPDARPPLDGDATTDVAVLGAGYCGLWAALELARRGLSVRVIEAHRAGFGASGRNGGQCGSGFNKDQAWIEARLGRERARALWDMAEAAKAQVRDFCAEHAPDARFLPGVAHGAYSEAEARDLFQTVEHLATSYGYNQSETFGTAGFADLVRSPKYRGGIVDNGAGHLHPMRYALALARAAEAAGAVIHEGTEVTRIDHGDSVSFVTPTGTVSARHAILAGNGYMPDLSPDVSARVMPINSFIATTEPLGDRAAEVLARDIAVADSKFVVNYYRMTEDRRFLFGGRESYTLGFPTDIATALRKRMEGLFPQLAGVRFSHVWGGTLGITMQRVPYIARIAPNVINASGFSGHGLALSGFAGRVAAEAVAGQAGRFDTLSSLPVSPFPGGASLRAPLLTLAMTWYALRDRLGV